MATVETWRWKNALATWRYSLLPDAERGELDDAGKRAKWLAEKVVRLLNLLGEWMTVERVSVTTASDGDDAFTASAATPDWLESFGGFLYTREDVVQIDMSLTLLRKAQTDDRRSTEVTLEGGASLSVYVEVDEKGRLDAEAEAPAWLSFSLNVDCDAPTSWGKERDNRLPASVNLPRLRSFLERLASSLPAVLLEIEAPDYKDQVDANGFIA